MDTKQIEALRAEIAGPIVTPQDSAYDELRQVFNAMFDRRPAAIVRCTRAADVVAAVNFVRSQGVPFSVKGSGHNVAGLATCEGGVMIDLSLMKGIEVDPERRIARAEPGLTGGELDEATQAHGLATTLGLVSHTGIAGLTLGGGLGWLARKWGLSIDSLVAVEIVTANGELITASESENPDLFWGVRGGGGNFGIVTAFTYRLHPVGPTVLGGMALYPWTEAREIARFFRDYMAKAPDELQAYFSVITAPEAPFLPVEYHGRPIVAIAACHAGTVEEGLNAIEPIRTFRPAIVDFFGAIPYVQHQKLFDASFPVRGRSWFIKSSFLSAFGDDAVDIFLEGAARFASPFSILFVEPLGGALGRVGPLETAYAHRDAAFGVEIIASWIDPVDTERNVAWVRDCYDALRPFMSGRAYVNFLTEEGEDQVRAAYPPEVYERLVALKNKYDPENLFSRNQNIKPTVGSLVTAQR
jgi:hypothetical protein